MSVAVEEHKKFVHFYGLKLKVAYGARWLSVDGDGTVRAWFEQPQPFVGDWWHGDKGEALCCLVNKKKLNWQGTLTEIEYKTQRDQVIAALKTPMTIIELYEALPGISHEVIAPIVTNLYTDRFVFRIGSKEQKWKNTMKQHYIFSSREEDRKKDQRFVTLDTWGIYTNILGIKPPDPKFCKGKTVHACNDEKY